MKHCFWILVLATSWTLSSCSDYGCEMACTYEEKGAVFGYIPFEDSTAYWLPSNPESLILFKDSTGKSIGFTLFKDTNTELIQRAVYEYPASECCKERVTDYIMAQSLNLLYKPAQPNHYNIRLCKRKNIFKYHPYSNKDSFPIKGHGDIIEIEIANNVAYWSRDPQSILYYNIKHFPSITLAGKEFTDVYQVENFQSKDYYNPVVIKTVYFKPGTGLLAISEYSGILWVKE